MRNFITLALLLLFASCEDTGHHFNCSAMIFSDALPIQVWQDGCLTYNENVPKGVHKGCFIAPILCDQDLRFQFTDSELGDYELVAFQENGNEIQKDFEVSGSDPLPPLQFNNYNFSVSLSGWDNFNGSNRASAQSFDWASDGGTGAARADASVGGAENSKYLAVLGPGSGWPAGDYVVRVRAKNNSIYGGSGGGTVGVNVWRMSTALDNTVIPSTGSPLPLDNTYYTFDIAFTLTGISPYLAFTLDRLGGGGTFDLRAYFDFIEILSAPTLYNSYVYNAVINPEEEDPALCGHKLRFEIQRVDASPPVVGRTDWVEIVSADKDIVVIEYSNPTDYNGLVYSENSPPESFIAVLPAIFFEEREVQETETLELSGSTVVTSSEIKFQRLLQMDYLPSYMHRKAVLMLSHKFITIDSKPWIKEEDYARGERSRMNPTQKAEVWLTEQDVIVRNV